MHKRLLLALLVVSALGCSNETAGPRGPQGPTGPAGPQGERGEKGDKGNPGEVGPTGEQGLRGEAGAQGLQGETGPAGEQGPQGPQGVPGLSVDAVSVSEGDPSCQFGGAKVTAATGDVYVCNGAPGPQGAQGPAGTQGVTGATGPSGPQGAPGQSVVAVALSSGDTNCPFGGSQFNSSSSATYACNGAPGPIGPIGPVGPFAASVYDSNGRRVGDFLGYEAISWYASILRLILVAEEWSGRRVIARRRDGSDEMEVAGRAVLFTGLNCTGTPFSDSFNGSMVFRDLGGSNYYVNDGAKQTEIFLSTRPAGVCVNITPEQHEYYPAVQIAPPLPYAMPLVLKLN